MSDVGHLPNGLERGELEQRAEAVRSRLERRLDELDERRDRVMQVARAAARPPLNVVLLGTASVVGVELFVHQLRRRPSARQRVGSRLLNVPAQRPSFLRRAIEGAALSFVTLLAQRLSARGLERFLPAEGSTHEHDGPRPELTRPE